MIYLFTPSRFRGSKHECKMRIPADDRLSKRRPQPLKAALKQDRYQTLAMCTGTVRKRAVSPWYSLPTRTPVCSLMEQSSLVGSESCAFTTQLCTLLWTGAPQNGLHKERAVSPASVDRLNRHKGPRTRNHSAPEMPNCFFAASHMFRTYLQSR